MKNILNYETCVIACSGPSLNKVDVFSLGLPVVAISTTIRKIPNPNYWVCSDYLNDMHADEGKRAYENADIIKIFQEDKLLNPEKAKNLFAYKVHKTNKNSNVPTDLFDFSKPFIRGPHKSVTFAIQWAHSVGIKNIIFAGNDLYASSIDDKYCYGISETDKRKKHNFLKTLNEVKDTLVWWYTFAKQKGYEWYSWDCGTVFESIVPKLTDELKEKFTINEEIKEENDQSLLTKIPTYSRREQLEYEKNQNRAEEMDRYMALMKKVHNL
jgi:hypothetical protein